MPYYDSQGETVEASLSNLDLFPASRRRRLFVDDKRTTSQIEDGIPIFGGRSGRLDDKAVTDAARADLDPPDVTVDQRPHRLDIGFKTTGAHVVGVTDVAPHRRSFSTHFAASCHGNDDTESSV